MSWNVNFIGVPDSIVAELEKESERLTGASKSEFDVIKPLLACLVRQNFDSRYDTYKPVMHLQASGHAGIVNGDPQYGNVSVSLQPFSGLLV